MNRRQNLSDLPNISFVLAENLSRVGICTPEQLARAGAVEVFGRLRASGLRHADHVLLALEGAICGVPWQSLPSPRRHELMHYMFAG